MAKRSGRFSFILCADCRIPGPLYEETRTARVNASRTFEKLRNAGSSIASKKRLIHKVREMALFEAGFPLAQLASRKFFCIETLSCCCSMSLSFPPLAL